MKLYNFNYLQTYNSLSTMSADKQTSHLRSLVQLESFFPLQLKKKKKDQLGSKYRFCCESNAGPLAARLCDYFWMPQSCGCTAKLLSET